MKKFVIILLLLLSNGAHAYKWTFAIPTEVHIVPEGLVLIGAFDNTEIICATGSKAIFLPNTDPDFKLKLSLALTAHATGKAIKVLINDPLATNCKPISAHGYVPITYHAYWQLLN